jgi:hypothetical protein
VLAASHGDADITQHTCISPRNCIAQLGISPDALSRELHLNDYYMQN